MSYRYTERVKLIERISKAVIMGETFVILYRGANEKITLRKVNPIRLEHLDDESDLLHAFCILRMEYRSFKMDRILEAYFRDVDM